MKVATYNVNGVSSRLNELLAWLTREWPDVVCLQELKAPDNLFPAIPLRKIGYGAIWHGQASWNGVAILAKGVQPVETRRGLGMFVMDGAGKRLLQGERQRFLKEEWPKIRATIQRLGLTPEELLSKRHAKEER